MYGLAKASCDKSFDFQVAAVVASVVQPFLLSLFPAFPSQQDLRSAISVSVTSSAGFEGSCSSSGAGLGS